MKKNIFKNFIFALAPMAGVTDFAFRNICSKFGADIVFTEMISTKAYQYSSEKTKDMLKEEKHKSIKIVQLFGHDLESFLYVINSGALDKFDGIDINCGCPAPKIVKNYDGSSMMKNIENTEKIIKGIRQHWKKLLSVKFRLGIENNINYLEFGKMCENAGADFITLHARTREQQYGGEVDKEAYKNLVENLKIPVIWSGDILTEQDVEYAKKIGCKGVMIGRGAMGNPQIFADFKHIKYPLTKKAVILQHLNSLRASYKREEAAMDYFKKHLAWYLKGIKNSSELKLKAVTVKNIDEMLDIINSLPENF